jgi:hypothetical protein
MGIGRTYTLDRFGLTDGDYEYEFVVNGTTATPDPYADEITLFDGYRGILTIAGGRRVSKPFRWDGEIPAGINLPQNNQIAIYEMPIKWMSSDPSENAPAEDSNRRFVTTGDDPFNPGGHKVVDAIWNFGYRDEIRRLATNAINTAWGQPSSSVRCNI